MIDVHALNVKGFTSFKKLWRCGVVCWSIHENEFLQLGQISEWITEEHWIALIESSLSIDRQDLDWSLGEDILCEIIGEGIQPIVDCQDA
ncbi:hypothetical protein PGT21_027613 [Puccinia graminis f. sp. tritici]|uniref:Uncharacterized protein n=1 Tax=Puccinia graminis f. sp. tritici TaxID=56615 RepID=A0A5B0S661_PUCGR|nr:hypothetical protein PGT21_027613 [Puccinia graminis f. sp. tritici]KAA1132969.1 hypothetical protein PGTUg99_015287 [Puccinia graminis f. sp. tritici]